MAASNAELDLRKQRRKKKYIYHACMVVVIWSFMDILVLVFKITVDRLMLICFRKIDSSPTYQD